MVTQLDVDMRLGDFFGDVLKAGKRVLQLTTCLPGKITKPRHIWLFWVFLGGGEIQTVRAVKAVKNKGDGRTDLEPKTSQDKLKHAIKPVNGVCFQTSTAGRHLG